MNMYKAKAYLREEDPSNEDGSDYRPSRVKKSLNKQIQSVIQKSSPSTKFVAVRPTNDLKPQQQKLRHETNKLR